MDGSKKIKELRMQTGMSRQQFADYLGIPRGTIRNWEQGVSKPADYFINLIEKLLIYETIIHIYSGTYMNVHYYWDKDCNGYHLYILNNKEPVKLITFPAVYVQDYKTFYKLEAEIQIEKFIENNEVDKYYEKLCINA